jgi:hypothetical protein
MYHFFLRSGIMAMIISDKVRAKLANKDRPVTQEEICECFENRCGLYLKELRPEHQTDPPTLWFIAETHYGRKLKVVFVPTTPDLEIKTAYDPNFDELEIYRRKGGQI